MNKSNKFLSELVAYRTYAKHLSAFNRRESLEETINRNLSMYLEKYPKLSRDIIKAFKQVHDFNVMPSMRSLQFGGEAIFRNNVRLFNCSFANITYPRIFAEALFLLLSGTGFGYSVQNHHIKQLPPIKKPKEENVYIVHDSIEGWAEALNQLMSSYFFGSIRPIFDFSKVRQKGSYLVTTGAKAPGPEPLKKMLEKVEELLKTAIGRRLKSLEVHDMVCLIADCVLSGGIRRAALISLFDRNDKDMLTSKHGAWWEKYPHRARANNSAVLPRHEVTYEEFKNVYDMCIASNAGEPGFFWTNDVDHGTNPCKPLYSTILTNKGYITFEQALKQESLIVMGVDGKWKEATKPFKTGESRQIARITLSNGNFLYGTDNHEHQLFDGTWKQIKDLEIGDKLKYANKKVYENTFVEDVNSIEYKEGLICGWVHGDGWFFKRKDSSGHTIGMCFGINEKDVVSYFEKELGVEVKPHAQKPETCSYFSSHRKNLADILINNGVDLDKNNLTWLYGKSKDFKLGFLKAVFTADGSVRKNNNVELYSSRRDSLDVISNILKEFGIYNTVCLHSNKKTYISTDNKIRNNKECYKINVYAGQYKDIGFISKIKNDLLDKQEKKEIYRYKEYATIVDINMEYDIQDVYDITVYDETHSFYDTGVVTHNCAEIGLQSNQFCNLSSANLTGIKNEKDFHNRVYATALLGTLQAGFTEFPYLSNKWKEITEQEALIGCSFTGIADATSISGSDLQKAAKLVLEVNEKYARKIGINLAARTTAIKPEGTASCVLGSSSGIHARHSEFYLRRVRMNKDDELARYLMRVVPELVEEDVFSPSGVVVTIPQESPQNAITRHSESALELFDRVKHYYNNWVIPGHREGANTHNISCTINYKPEEVESLLKALWEDRFQYAAVSLLPFSDTIYQQAPFEDCNKETFEKYNKMIKEIDLTKVFEMEDNTNRAEQLACSGGTCEII